MSRIQGRGLEESGNGVNRRLPTNPCCAVFCVSVQGRKGNIAGCAAFLPIVASRGFRLDVPDVYIGRRALPAVKAPVCGEVSGRPFVKKKLGFDARSVHSRFTPAGFILMTDIVQLSFGGQRAPAGR